MNLKQTFTKIKFFYKKNEPKILKIASTVGLIGGTVLIAKEARGMDSIIDEYKINVEKVRAAKEVGRIVDSTDPETGTMITRDYSDKEAAKDLIKVYAVTAGKLVKHFAPGAVVFTVSMLFNHRGYNILEFREAKNLATIGALNGTVDKLSNFIKAKQGDDALTEALYGIKSDVDEHGEKVYKRTERTDEMLGHNQFSRFFDDTSRYYIPHQPMLNLNHLIEAEKAANKIRIEKSMIDMAEIYDLCGFVMSPEMRREMRLWYYGEEDDVSFNIFRVFDSAARDFVNGVEEYILLDSYPPKHM